MTALRSELDEIVAPGLAGDPLEHARQVARIAGVLHRACTAAGLRATLVGGSAIEVHAPGVYTSDDIDVVIEGPHRPLRDRIAQVFTDLGFSAKGRHWVRGDLFVEVPGHALLDPHETMRVGSAVFEVVTKEVVLADRIVGFRQWGYTAFGQQAVDLLAAFEDRLDLAWLEPKLKQEHSWEAFEALRALAQGDEPVTEATLQGLLGRLRGASP